MKRQPRAGLVISAALMLVSCRDPSAVPGEAAHPAASGQGSADAPAAGAFVQGGTRAALVSYLRTVRETPAKKFEVRWNPDVVKIDRQTAIDTLQAVSADGVTFRFAASSRTRALTEGRILFLWGLALRRVIHARAEADQWVVDTAPVSFPEVFDEADIDYDYPLDARQMFAVFRPPVTQQTAANATPRALYVGFINQARAEEGAAGPQIVNLPNSFATRVNGIDLELAYAPIEGGLHFDIEARKQQSDVQAAPEGNPRRDIEDFAAKKRREEAGAIRDGAGRGGTAAERAGAAADKAGDDWKKVAGGGANAPNKALTQGLFDIGSALWDLRLRASGDLTGISASDSLSVSNQLQIHGAALGLLKTEFRNVNGNLKLQFIARRGESSEQWIEKLKVDIPIRFNIPVIVAGLPMVFQIGFDVIAQPALTTRNDTFDAEYDIPFSGSGTVQLEGDRFTVGGTLAAQPNPLKTLASSIGVSAVLVALQAPRVGLGVGIFGASSVVYIDLVSSATITSGGQLGLVPCHQYTLVTSINAGVDTRIALDVPGLGRFLASPLNEKLKQAGNAASLREEIFKKNWYRAEPDMPICRAGGDQ
ncbi:MAG: hypothetical protein QM696_06530 [Steroidobacteraceae bacterium]